MAQSFRHFKRFHRVFRPCSPLTEHQRLTGKISLVLQRNIEGLKAGPLSLGDAQRKLFEIFYRRLLPARMLIPVTDSYLSKEDRTDWGLLNTLTLHAKNLPPNGNIRTHAQLGRYFGLGTADPYAC